MEILVKRKIFGDATLGELFINGSSERFCYTLEDKVRQANVKIKHETAIPIGRYKVVVNYSNRFKRMMLQILNVPNFEGIRIHGGNTIADTSGCILVAKNKVNSSTIQGTQESRIFKLVSDAINRNEECWITIA